MNDLPQTVAELDDHLVQVLESYLADLEAGSAVPRAELLARYPELAESLDACLASLEFIRRAGRQKDKEASQQRNGSLRPGERLGDYRLLREIGRGGMGIVYEAKGPNSGRLALKVLPPAAALDERQLQRFKNETQATALLQHPHIVPVVDVGFERDVHFYVMPLIEGHSLAEVLRELRRPQQGDGMQEKSSSVRVLADDLASGRWAPSATSNRTRDLAASATAVSTACGRISTEKERHIDNVPSQLSGQPYFRTIAHLGVQAAEALEQAHQAGIVHRDIKPGNLLVDGHGHLWIVDFGLARWPGEASLTVTGDLIGTLRYMSPEQALGKRGVVDQRSDVYSLGVTLYELLTLQPAIPGEDRQELLRRIAEDEPVRPRQLNRAIPSALEIILLKAIAKEPGERYATAQELADDLRRFLAGLPLKARRPSLPERARKWAWRHRRLVFSAAALTLLALVGMSVSVAVVSAERDEAQHRAAQAWQAADDMYTRVAQEWLHHQPHLEPVQREFLLKALAFFEEFAREHGANSAARLEAAKALRRVADIRHKLGENAAAAQAYDQALARLTTLTNEAPEDVAARAELAYCQNNRGTLLRDSGRLAEAETCYQQAYDLFGACAAASPKENRFREARAGSLHNLALIRHSLGRTRDAEAAYRQALTEFAALAREQPEIPAHRHALAGAESNLANLLRETGRPAEALTAYRQALARWQQLIDAYPGIPLYRQAQATGASGQGVVLAALGRSREAEQAHLQALHQRERLAGDFPRVPAYRQELAASYNSLARLFAAAGKVPQAQSAFDRSLTLRKQLATEFSAFAPYRQELADTQYGIADLLALTGRPRSAEQAHRSALALRQPIAEQMPEVAASRWDLARSYRALSRIRQTLGQESEAETACRTALKLDTQLTQAVPKISAYRLELAATLNSLGMLLQAKGRLGEAKQAHLQAQQLRADLAAEFPDSPYYRFEKAVGRRYLGTLFQAAGDLREAEDAYREALHVAEELSSGAPHLAEYRWLVAASSQNLAELLFASGRLAEVGPVLDRVRTLWQKLAADYPAYPDYCHELARSECSRARLLRAVGKRAEAEAALGKALALRLQLAISYPEVPGYSAAFARVLADGPLWPGLKLVP